MSQRSLNSHVADLNERFPSLFFNFTGYIGGSSSVPLLLLQRTLTPLQPSDPILTHTRTRRLGFQNSQIFRQIDRIAEVIRWRKATAAQSKPSTHPSPMITRRNFNNWSLKIKRIRSLLHSIFVSCICFVLILREPVWLPRNVWEKKRKLES